MKGLVFAGLVFVLSGVHSIPPPKFGDLGPREEKGGEYQRTCTNVMKMFKWISCDRDGSFAPLQCDPRMERCFCLHGDGTRMNHMTMAMKNASMRMSDVCDKSCPPLKCRVYCSKYETDTSTGCRKCQCADEVNTCPLADSVVQQCTRDCLNESMKNCAQCRPRCVGGMMDDKCSRNYTDSCGMNGTCVTQGKFATRICYDSGLYEGDRCKLPKLDNKGEKHKNLMQNLKGIKIRSKAGNFEPVKPFCQNETVCYPVNGSGGVCRSKESIGGPCFNNSDKLKCNIKGLFHPLQCFKNHSFCWCVHPSNGTVIPNTKTKMELHKKLPECTDKVFKKCSTQLRGARYKVGHDQYGVNASNCKRCLCEDGNFNESTCMAGRNCTLFAPNVTKDCRVNNQNIKHQQVFKADDCNKCKCLGGRVSGCTRRRCHGHGKGRMVTECDKCKEKPWKPVCGPNGVTYDNLCTVEYCAGFDALEVTPGPCSIQDLCYDIPCEKGLTCVSRKRVCGMRRGCDPKMFRRCINETKLACPMVDDSDSDQVCGSDGRTYASVCRMILETDGVKVMHGGPCNNAECPGGQVCGTDGVTYPSKCTLQTASSNVRVDYKGMCLGPQKDETITSICKRVRRSKLCKSWDQCKKVILPTDGCCPICGGALNIALDEDGLQAYSDLKDPQSMITLDDLTESIAAVISLLPEVLKKCIVEPYLTSDGNIQVLLMSANSSLDDVCFKAAENMTRFINNQSDGTISTADSDPVLSFLTAGSTLEVETGLSTSEGGAKSILSCIGLTLLAALMVIFLV